MRPHHPPLPSSHCPRRVGMACTAKVCCLPRAKCMCVREGFWIAQVADLKEAPAQLCWHAGDEGWVFPLYAKVDPRTLTVGNIL